MADDALLPGCKVRIRGLQSRIDLNGCSGIVLDGLQGERYPVRVKPPHAAEVVRVRPVNLVVTDAPSSAAARDSGWLSSLLMAREAGLFEEMAERVGQMGGSFRNLINDKSFLQGIESALRAALDDESVTVALKGGVAKGTHTRQSDIDVVISTPGRSVSRAEKQAVAEKLRTARGFHKSHVKLKRLAISCVYNHSEVDLVFDDTVEYGQLPGSIEERFEGNKAAQHAARMLKVAVQQSAAAIKPEQLPSFVLELLVLEAQERRGELGTVLADGSMQLFVDALQLLLDSKPGEVLTRWFEIAAAEADGRLQAKLEHIEGVSLRRHAGAILHLLCVSRLYSPGQSGFSRLVEIEQWIRCMTPGPNLETPLGIAPSWIFGYWDKNKGGIYGFICSEPADSAPSSSDLLCSPKECEDAVHMLHAAPLFVEGPFGKYTEVGAKRASAPRRVPQRVPGGPPPFAKRSAYSGGEMERLRKLAANGSQVAQHMFASRSAWAMGEAALRAGDYPSTVRWFGTAARGFHHDGDPFKGCYFLDGSGLRAYHEAADALLQSTDPAAALNARILRALTLLQEGSLAHSEAEFTRCIKDSPDDAALYHLRSTVRGNLSKWEGVLEDIDRCIELEPEEPISYFWRAVALRNIKDGSEAEDEPRRARKRRSRRKLSSAELKRQRLVVASYRRFLDLAPPEGRKVCQAWFDMLVATTMLSADDDRSTVRDRLLEMANEGFAAEERMLAPLREHEAKGRDSHGKQMARFYRDMFSGMTPEATESDRSSVMHEMMTRILHEQRTRANAAFRAGHYETAAAAYTEILNAPTALEGEQYEGTHKVLSNRSAALEKLQDYGAAERDALEAIRLEPTWLKGYVRLVRARLGRRDAAGAMQAIEQGVAEAGDDLEQLRPMEAEVRALLAESTPTRSSPQSFTCWEEVRYQDSVLVVDLAGSGDYTSLRDAVTSAAASGKPSTIIMLAGQYTVSWPHELGRRPQSGSACGPMVLQIIGEGRVQLENGPNSESGVLIQAKGKGASLSVERLEMSNLSPTAHDSYHCVRSAAGAAVSVRLCTLRSTGASCAVDGKGSTLEIIECNAHGPGSAALVDEGALEARDSVFVDSTSMAVEIRGGGSGSLVRCTMAGSAMQGLNVHCGGASAELLECTIKECGSFASASAVLVGSGEVTIRRCKITNNRGDGIILQAQSDKTRLKVIGSLIYANGGLGIGVYGGSAEIRDNKLHENGGIAAICIHAEFEHSIPTRSLSLVRNNIYGNAAPDFDDPDFDDTAMGGEMSINVSGNDGESMKSLRKRVNFDGNHVSGLCTLCTGGAIHSLKAKSMDEVIGLARLARRRPDALVDHLIAIDPSTGREIHPSRGKGPVSAARRGDSTADVIARMASSARNQTEPTGDDFITVTFHKQALIDWQERIVDERDARPDDPITKYHDGAVPGSKASGASTRLLTDLTECRITDLATSLGSRATGRVLYGELCTRPTRWRSLMTVLADEHGDGVALALYNVNASVGDSTLGLTLKRCALCGEARYCGTECQRADWKFGGHQHGCSRERSKQPSKAN